MCPSSSELQEDPPLPHTDRTVTVAPGFSRSLSPLLSPHLLSSPFILLSSSPLATAVMSHYHLLPQQMLGIFCLLFLPVIWPHFCHLALRCFTHSGCYQDSRSSSRCKTHYVQSPSLSVRTLWLSKVSQRPIDDALFKMAAWGRPFAVSLLHWNSH